MTGKLRSAMLECAKHSSDGVQALRALMNENPGDFLRASISLLRYGPEAPGYEQLLRQLASDDQVIEGVCDPDLLSQEESVGLAALLAGVEPQIDTKLARLLHRAHAGVDCPERQASMERTLALLDATPCSRRIGPALASLLSDPNPRFRAKLTKLVGRCVQNTTFASESQRDSDPRVRANAIESLWGDKAISARSVLWAAAKDASNRVVGNALLGLYQLQDRNAIASILAMAADASPLFRASAAWVMGQTADPRFLEALQKLARDLYAPVRKNSARATKLIELSAPADTLQTGILRTEREGKDRTLWFQALDQGGDAVRGLLPSQFILWSDQKLVVDYEVIEHDASHALGVAFALCQEGAEDALANCLHRKAPGHLWSVAKFYQGDARISRIAPAALETDHKTLEASLARSPLAAKECPFLTMLPLLYQTDAGRHLVLFAGNNFAPDSEKAIAIAARRRAAIHAIVAGSPSAGLTHTCERTGGMLFSVSEASQIGPAFRRLYSALSNHYTVRYRPDSAAEGRIEVHSKEWRGGCSIPRSGIGL